MKPRPTLENLVAARDLLAVGCCGRGSKPSLARLAELLDLGPIPPFFYSYTYGRIAPHSGLRAFSVFAVSLLGIPVFAGENPVDQLNNVLARLIKEQQ